MHFIHILLMRSFCIKKVAFFLIKNYPSRYEYDGVDIKAHGAKVLDTVLADPSVLGILKASPQPAKRGH